MLTAVALVLCLLALVLALVDAIVEAMLSRWPSAALAVAGVAFAAYGLSQLAPQVTA